MPRLEELETRLAPATVQFSAGAETVNATDGTFSIPVTLTGSAGLAINTYASGLSTPNGVAIDTFHNLYVANTGNGTVSKITPEGTVSTFASGFDEPVALAFDAAGNLYVANYGEDGINPNSGDVNKVTPAGVVTVFASNSSPAGLYKPAGLAFDAAGNLYVSNQVPLNILGFSGYVTELAPDGTFVNEVQGFDSPSGLAFGPNGNLYVSNDGDNSVDEIVNGAPTPVAANFATPDGLAFDANGLLYVANNADGTVSQVVLPAGTSATFASGLDKPAGLEFDGSGNLYVANSGTDAAANANTVTQLSPNVIVPFSLGGTAANGIDFSHVQIPLVFRPGQFTVDITGTLLSDPGNSQTITFTLGTPSNNASLGTPTVNTLTIDEPNPDPTLTGVNPNSAVAGQIATVVVLTGTGFDQNSEVEFNGTHISTTYVSPTELKVVLPPSDFTTAGSDVFNVINPAPGGGTSAAQSFTVSPAAVIIVPSGDSLLVQQAADGVVGDVTYTLTDSNGTTEPSVTLTGITSLTIPGEGDNTVTIAVPAGGTLMSGDIQFDGGAGANGLVVDDRASSAPAILTVTDNQIITQDGTATEAIRYLGTNGSFGGSITLDGGDGGNFFNVQSTAAGAPVTVNTGTGSDFVSVTNGGLLTALAGVVNVVAHGANTTLSVDGHLDAGSGALSFAANQIAGSAPGFTINYSATGAGAFSTVTLAVGSGDDPILVRGTPAGAVTGILAEGGNDTVGVTSTAGTLDTIKGVLNFDLGSGQSALNLYEGGATAADAVAVSASSFHSTVLGLTINYKATGGGFGGGVSLVTGSGNDTVVVQSQLAGAPLTVNTGAGADVVGFQVTPASAYSNVTVFGGGDDGDTLALTDLTVAGTATVRSGGLADMHYPPPGLDSLFTALGVATEESNDPLFFM